MSGNPDAANGAPYTPLEMFVMELFRTISPNGGSISSISDTRQASSSDNYGDSVSPFVRFGLPYERSGYIISPHKRRPRTARCEGLLSQTQIETPDARISVTIGTLDITSAGGATLEADWTLVPRDPARPTRRQRARFVARGPVATDQDVVNLMQAVLTQLADAIVIGHLH
jgi:ABC-type transport auxiliary lipoprotein component